MTDSTHLSAETAADMPADELFDSAEPAGVETPAATLAAGRTQLAQAVVEVPLPQPGQTIVVQAAAGQTLRFLFDPATASAAQENGDLVLQINGGEVVIENWEAATSGEIPVEITNADGTVINMADFLVAIGLPPGGDTEPAAGGQPTDEPLGAAPNQGAGFSPVQAPSILGTLDPEGPVDPTALSYRVPERDPFIFDIEEDEPGPNAENDGPGTSNEADCVDEKNLLDGGEGGGDIPGFVTPSTFGNVLHNDSFGDDGAGGIVSIEYLGGDSADPLTVTNDGGFPIITFTANDGNDDIWTLEFNLETGDYFFTLLAPYQHSGAGEDQAHERFSYTIEDADGDTDTATLTICIKDDVPSIEFGGAEGGFTVDESVGYGGYGYGSQLQLLSDDNAGDEQFSSDPEDIGYTKVSLFSVFGLFYDFGADGPGEGQFALSLSADGVDSGLVDTESGESIFLFNESGVIVGREGGAGGDIAFTIEIDGEDLEIHQYRAIRHDDAPDDHDESDDPESIAPGVLNLTATIIDDDGDTASDSIDLGQLIRFEDDGPTACIDGGEGGVIALDETENDGDDTAGDGLLAKVTVAGGLLFDNHSEFGSDGEKAGGGNSFALILAAPGVDSGLIDTATGNHVFMFLVNGQVVGKEGTDAGDAEANGEVVFTISVDAATGDVTVAQSRAVEHDDPSDPDEEGSPETIADGTVGLELTVTDGDGDTDSASIDLGSRIQFRDDGPTVEVVGGEGMAVLDESVGQDPADPNAHDETAAGATPGAIGYATLSAAAFFSVDAGSDGETSRAFALTLSAEGADSGLVDTATGNSVFLFLIDGKIVGREGTDATDAKDNGEDVFVIEIDAATGAVEVNQFRAIEHDDPTDADEADSPESIAAGLVGVELTVTDGDGDTDSASIDLGSKILFEDDGPAGIVVGGEGELRLDETVGDDEPASPDANDIGFDSIPVSSFFPAAIDPGSDGPGTSPTYTLTVPANGTPSGLFETASGHQIFLFDNGGVIEGRAGADAAAAETGTLMFKVSIVGGNVEVHQYEAIRHDDAPDDHDEADDPESIAAGALILEVTATDGDNDPVAGSVDLGQLIKFEDDGPTASLAPKTEGTFLILDETRGDKAGDINSDDEEGSTAPNDIGYATALASNLFTVNVAFGSDGEKAGGGRAYELVLNGIDGVDSGLKDAQSQSAIVLVDNNGVIEGRVGDVNGTPAFTISIDPATGEIEVHQYRAVFHLDPAPANDHDQAGSPESIDVDLVKVKLTVTDGDGDQASSNLAELGSLIKFEDDGPTVDLALEEGAEIRVDESDNDGDENGSGLLAQVTVAGSALFNATVDAGSDGELDRGYVLTLTGGNGASSGLVDTLSDENVLLYQEGKEIVGRTAVGGQEVFRISIDASTGDVTVTQSRAVVHDDPTDPDEADTPKSIAPGLVEAVLAVIDGDGDGAGDEVDLGAIIKFEDDGPTFDATGAENTTVDEDDLPTGTDGSDSLTVTGEIGVDFGSDGPGDVSGITGPLGLTSDGAPITYSFDPATNTLTGSAGGTPVFTVTIDPATGEYTFELKGPIDHGESEDSKALQFDFTVTDGDGDPVDGSFTVNVTDDGPAPEGDTATVGDAGNTVTNLVIVFDRSGSMDEDPGVDGYATRIDLARAAVAALMNSYETFGSVNIKIVDFASGANSSAWFTAEDGDPVLQAIDYLAGLTPNGNTNYAAAVQKVQDSYGDAPDADQQFVYFLSDGNPTAGGKGDVFPFNDDNPNDEDFRLLDTQVTAWESFLQSNNFNKAFAVGVGAGVTNIAALEDIAYPNGDGDNNPIIVTDEEQLLSTLVETVGGGDTSGNVLSNDDFGADGEPAGGSYVASIVIGTDTFTYDPATNQISGPGGTFAGPSHVFTTEHGTLEFNFDTGEFTYKATDVSETEHETFTYTVVDGDGTEAEAELIVTINDVDTSVIARDDRIVTNVADGSSILIPAAALLFNDFVFDGGSLNISAVENALGGTVGLDGGNVQFNKAAATGGFDYTASNGGTDTAHVTITTDSDGALSGSAGREILIANDSGGTIDALGGSDVVVGGVGSDTVNGGAGADLLMGGGGADTLNGDAGGDYLDGGNDSDADTLNGGTGNDILVVGTNDTASGGDDSDIIILKDNVDFGFVDGGQAELSEGGMRNHRGDILVFDGELDLNGSDSDGDRIGDKIDGIETISMRDAEFGNGDTGADTLTLSIQDVLNLTTGKYNPDMPAPDNFGLALTLRVDGDGDGTGSGSDDVLNLTGGNWHQITPADAPAGYNVWVHDTSGTGTAEDAYVLVQEAVTVHTS